MSPACVVTGLVHNDFHDAETQSLYIPYFKPPGFPGGCLFLVFESSII